MSVSTPTEFSPVRTELSDLYPEVATDLLSRKSDGLTVTLWYVRSTSHRYITVEDTKGLKEGEQPTVQTLELEEDEDALLKFYHPCVYLPDPEESLGYN